MAGRLGSLALLLVSLAISCEVGSFVVLHYVLGIGWLPEYAQGRSPQGPGWLTEREAWGAWHAPNRDDRQQSRCFSVSLDSNSYGARDRERAVDGDPHRTVVLGDSFAEGWGVEADQRLSDLLEARYHREFLNFGVENDVGPLQYQILYERLASKFSHDRVLILFLPDNDFTDNDADYWRRFRPDFPERYRPYYQAAGAGEYWAFYPAPKPAEGYADLHSMPPAGWGAWAAAWPRRNLWSLAMRRYLGLQFYRMGTYSGYLDYTAEQLNAVLWSFARIKQLAGDRPGDFKRVAATGDHRLIEALDRFGREHGVEIVDLMQWMPTVEPYAEAYYLPCDGHWNAA